MPIACGWFLKYGRDAERQADDLGYRYALEQGYDVREMVNVFAALQQSAQLAGQSPVPGWLASHPYPEERIQRINKQLASLPPASTTRRIGEDDYLQRIDGLAYGENPREGFFDDNRFLHPELGLINQLQGPGDIMPANFRAKRVIETGS